MAMRRATKHTKLKSGAFAIRIEAASQVDVNDPKVRAVLFGQRAR
jgi:hypothetical protein